MKKWKSLKKKQIFFAYQDQKFEESRWEIVTQSQEFVFLDNRQESTVVWEGLIFLAQDCTISWLVSNFGNSDNGEICANNISTNLGKKINDDHIEISPVAYLNRIGSHIYSNTQCLFGDQFLNLGFIGDIGYETWG